MKRLCEVKGCRCIAQKHHIVFRSQGGLDIEVNYKYLCAEHHTGNESPHKDIAVDYQYKIELQNHYSTVLFTKALYTIEEIADLIGYNARKLQKKFKTVPRTGGILYKKEDIIRCLMGGRLY